MIFLCGSLRSKNYLSETGRLHTTCIKAFVICLQYSLTCTKQSPAVNSNCFYPSISFSICITTETTHSQLFTRFHSQKLLLLLFTSKLFWLLPDCGLGLEKSLKQQQQGFPLTQESGCWPL